MALTLTSFGSDVPENYLTTDEALYVAQHYMQTSEKIHRKIAKLYQVTAIKKRHSCLIKPRSEWNNKPEFDMLFPPELGKEQGPTTGQRMKVYEEKAFPLALSAAQKALQTSGFQPEEITHLVIVTCTGFFAPAIDIKLIKALGLQSTVERVQVGFMGCQGSVNGLRVANGFAHTDPKAKILMCAVELCTLHYHYGEDIKEILANALFADGASATIGIAGHSDWTIQATGSFLIPDSESMMSWHIRNHGFVMGLSPAVPRLIRKHLKSGIESWLAKQGLKIEDVKTWAVHPGGPSILTATQKALNLPDNALDFSWDILQNYGNMSSATLLFILEKLKQSDAKMPCVAMAFGPGLMCETVLFR